MNWSLSSSPAFRMRIAASGRLVTFNELPPNLVHAVTVD